MTETRFPSSGLSAEYGDIILSDVTADVSVSVVHSGLVVLDEVYKPDAANQVRIKNMGELAMIYFAPADMLVTSEDAEPVVLTIDITSGTTISKAVTFYPCVVDFSGSLTTDLLKLIPLSRATKKNTAQGRKEFVSFYGGKTVKVYAVYKGDTSDVGVTANLVALANAAKMYAVDVSPAVIAALISKPESKLVYYNVYTDIDCIIRFTVSPRYQQYEKTFVFRNCFGAVESFTCTGDEKSERKWTREFGDIDAKKIDFSRKMESSVKVNTGYITPREVEVVEDLVNSDDIRLIENSLLHRVTLLDENFDQSSRRDELTSVTFTYRLAQHNQFKTSYEAFKKPRIFTPDFDTSFE